MENISLKSDLKSIIANKENIEDIKIGSVSSNSIDIIFKNPISSSSYTYYDREKYRNSDYEKLLELILV